MGAQKISLLTLTLVASATITAGQFVTAAGAVATAGSPVIGVAVTDASNGDAFAVDVIGTTTLTADGPVTKGMELEVGASGKATEADEGRVVAVALEAASDGQKFEALLIVPGLIPDTVSAG
jgi:hypothetical protein